MILDEQVVSNSTCLIWSKLNVMTHDLHTSLIITQQRYYYYALKKLAKPVVTCSTQENGQGFDVICTLEFRLTKKSQSASPFFFYIYNHQTKFLIICAIFSCH
jgi:hypothetical protein